MPKDPAPSFDTSVNGERAPPEPSRKRVSEVYKRVAIKFNTKEEPGVPVFQLGIPFKGVVSMAELDWNGDMAAHLKALRLLKHCRTLDIILDTWKLPPQFKEKGQFHELETALASVTGVHINNGAEIPFNLPKLKRLVRSFTIPESFQEESKKKAFYEFERAPLPSTVRTVAYMIHFSKGVLDRKPAISALGLRDSPGVKQVYFQFDGDTPPPSSGTFVKGGTVPRLLFFLMGSIAPRIGKMNTTFLWRDRTNAPEDFYCTPGCSGFGPCQSCGKPGGPEDFSPDSAFVRSGLIVLTASVEWFRRDPNGWTAWDTGEFFNDGPLPPGATDEELGNTWMKRITSSWGTVEAAARTQKLDIRSFSGFQEAKEERLMPWPAMEGYL
ncbi:uncharacterized protein LOC62_07G008919 [Vanrija pseudolonga]|uniref:Uncharacterized protein n=1 Tax=Vanrija pseudolonga TaxID=143232 RepID=A0AAF0YET6_9TREE|nr:hypothetical protein LOC62_07G008919 [Vanrija pseudolonga]